MWAAKLDICRYIVTATQLDHDSPALQCRPSPTVLTHAAVPPLSLGHWLMPDPPGIVVSGQMTRPLEPPTPL